MASHLNGVQDHSERVTAIRVPELVIPVGLFALGAFLIFYSRENYVYINPASGPGPGFFPTWLGIALVILAAVLIISELISRRSRVPIEPEQAGGHYHYPPDVIVRPITLLLFAGLVGAAIWIMGAVGTTAALATFVFTESLLIERRGLVRAGVAAVFIPLAVFLIFNVALRVPLPGVLADYIGL